MRKKRNHKLSQEESQEVYDQNIDPIDAVDYTKNRMVLYGVNVSVARACSSLWDGLVPVVRRLLWHMYNNLNLLPSKRPMKGEDIVPSVTRYHPHGSRSIQQAFETIMKRWENNALLIDVFGNEGSVTGDTAGALRYLDAKLSLYAYKCFFEEFDSKVVDMQLTYLRNNEEPVWLPAKYPNFLINISTGIGWGNATSIVPFNLIEVFDLTQALMETPDMTNVYLFPDSPRGYDILDDGTIAEVCALGRGTVRIRAKLDYDKEGHYIRVTGFPEKTTMDAIIAEIYKFEKTQNVGIHDVIDRSNLETTEFWIDLKKGVDPDYVINELYSNSKIGLRGIAQIEFNFANRTSMLALSLKDSILTWIDWRIEVKHRLMVKKLLRLQEEKHRLEALLALRTQENVDKMFRLIRSCDTDEDIISVLTTEFGITSYQANVLSEMKAKQVSKGKLVSYQEQYDAMDEKIMKAEQLVISNDAIKECIMDELEEGKKLFGKPRCCRIIKPSDTEAPVFHYRVVVTKKYIKRLPPNGVGIGYLDADDDIVTYFHDITNEDYIHIGMSSGELCYLPIDKIPASDSSGKGTDLPALTGADGYAVSAYKTSLPSIRDHKERYRLYVFTKNGFLKATKYSEFTSTRNRVQAVSLNDDDSVCFMGLIAESDSERLVYTTDGYGIILDLSCIPSTGRVTKGTKYFKLNESAEIVGVCSVRGISEVCILTKKGFGKISELDKSFKASKRRQTMLELCRMESSDEILKVIPIDKNFYSQSIVFHMQNGEKTEFKTTDIKTGVRHAKCYKLVPVPKGNSIIRIKLI